MSLRMTKAVWKCSKAKGPARLVLLALADHADEEGRAWPSAARLARYTLMDVRNVHRALGRLVAQGEIVPAGKGKRGVVIYRLAPGSQPEAMAKSPEVEPADLWRNRHMSNSSYDGFGIQPPAKSSGAPLAKSPDKQSIEQSIEQSESSTTCEQAAVDDWNKLAYELDLRAVGRLTPPADLRSWPASEKPAVSTAGAPLSTRYTPRPSYTVRTTPAGESTSTGCSKRPTSRKSWRTTMRPINLPTPTGAPPAGVSAAGAPITMPLLPRSLRSLVGSDSEHTDAWPLPVLVPEDARPELPLVIASYQAAMRPARPQEIAVILARLAIHFPLPDLPAEHHRLALDDYASDLAEFPLGVVAEAAQDWRRTERWWPKVAELRARCEAILHQRRKEMVRLRFLQWCSEHLDRRVPQLVRRINGGLHDAGDGAPAWMLEEVMQGRREFGGLVFVLP